MNENELTADERKWQEQFQDLVGYLNQQGLKTEARLATTIARANGFTINPDYHTSQFDNETIKLLLNYYCSAHDGLQDATCEDLRTIGIDQQTIVYIQIITDSLKISRDNWNC